MKFYRLPPEQACAIWPLVRRALEESVPPNIKVKDDFFVKNLDDITNGVKVVWLGVDNNNNNKEMLLAITIITNDIDSDNRNVVLYSLYGMSEDEKVVGWMMREGLLTLLNYAAANNCNKVCAYTAFPKIVELAKRLGFDTQWTFLSMEVPNELKTKSNVGKI